MSMELKITLPSVTVSSLEAADPEPQRPAPSAPPPSVPTGSAGPRNSQNPRGAASPEHSPSGAGRGGLVTVGWELRAGRGAGSSPTAPGWATCPAGWPLHPSACLLFSPPSPGLAVVLGSLTAAPPLEVGPLASLPAALLGDTVHLWRGRSELATGNGGWGRVLSSTLKLDSPSAHSPASRPTKGCWGPVPTTSTGILWLSLPACWPCQDKGPADRTRCLGSQGILPGGDGPGGSLDWPASI